MQQPGTRLSSRAHLGRIWIAAVPGRVPDYTWTLVPGELPPGLELSESPGRITGTPTAAGTFTFTFTVRVTDDRDVFAERTFSITVS